MNQQVANVIKSTVEHLHSHLVNNPYMSFEEINSVRYQYIDSLKAQLNNDDYVRVVNEFNGAGPIESLLLDSSISEIMLNSFKSIWFEKNGTLLKHDDHFFDQTTYRHFFERIFASCQNEITIDNPFFDSQWRGFRIHVVGPPVSRELTMTIRKKSDTPWTIDRLRKCQWATEGQIQVLRDYIQNKKSILVVGGTGSGKTSVLNACLLELESSERVVIIEDTSELNLPNDISTSLVARHDNKNILKPVTLQDLLKQTLRMRPDRIVVGEVRGAEAKDLLMAFATGHDGSLGTLHANSAQEALLRLEMLVQLGAPQWSLAAIRKLIFLAIGAIVVVKRTPSKTRVLDSIHRIAAIEDFGLITEPLI